jgi:prolipoprotein diacylglyceryltransferase
MDRAALDQLLAITATHEAHAWQLTMAVGALAALAPLLFLSRIRRVRAREARLLVAGLAGAAAGAALLPMLLRAPAALATRSLAPLATGDRMAIGALLGFAAAAGLAARCRGLAPLRALDRLAPSMGLLVLIGRAGCFLEGCDFGSVTRAPWAVIYPPGSHAFDHQLARGMVRAADAGSLPVHPAQLYEAIVGVVMVTAAALVLRAQRSRRAAAARAAVADAAFARHDAAFARHDAAFARHDAAFARHDAAFARHDAARASTAAPPTTDGAALRVALAIYAAGRLVVEVFRGDDRGALGPLSTPQWMALALLAWAAAGLFAERGDARDTGAAALSRNRTRLPN